MSRHAKTDREKAITAGIAKPADPEVEKSAADAPDTDADDRATLIEQEEQAKAALAAKRVEHEKAVERKASALDRRYKAQRALDTAEAARPITPQSMADAANARIEIEGAEADGATAEGEIVLAEQAVERAQHEVDQCHADLIQAALPNLSDALLAKIDHFAEEVFADWKALRSKVKEAQRLAPDRSGVFALAGAPWALTDGTAAPCPHCRVPQNLREPVAPQASGPTSDLPDEFWLGVAVARQMKRRHAVEARREDQANRLREAAIKAQYELAQSGSAAGHSMPSPNAERTDPLEAALAVARETPGPGEIVWDGPHHGRTIGWDVNPISKM